MVFPVILTVTFFFVFPFLIMHGGFWSLYQTVASCHQLPASWPGYMLQHGWIGMTLVLLGDGVTFWTESRCLFIFERFNRSGSLLLAHPVRSVMLGGLAGATYAAALVRLLAWYYPLEPAAQTLAHNFGAGATFVLFGVAQGVVIAEAISRGVAREAPTSRLASPPGEVITGEMPIPIR